MRVNIPGNPEDLIALAQAILAQHKADGPNSPLAGLKMIDMATQTAVADTSNKLSRELYRQAEKATNQRDIALGQSGQMKSGSVRFFVASARDLLLALNKGSGQKLVGWGFELDSSAEIAAAKSTGRARASL